MKMSKAEIGTHPLIDSNEDFSNVFTLRLKMAKLNKISNIFLLNNR
jgi:hypothetical protein